MKNIAALIVLSLCMIGPAFADGEGVDCHAPENVKLMEMEKHSYQDMLAHDKAGRTRQAYDIARQLDPYCISKDEKEINRIEAEKITVLKKSGIKLGEEAESKGRFTEAYDYFVVYDGVAADRVKMKLATSKPDDFETVRTGVSYFRNMQDTLNRDIDESMRPKDRDRARLAVLDRMISQETLDATDPDREKRLQAISGYRSKLDALATKNGERFLIAEDKVFAARKTSITAKENSLDELKRAKDWLELARQEKRANDRAVARGDTLMADDGRKSLELAISYYQFADNEKKVAAVTGKARRLGDAQLQKGNKVIAAEYYDIAGLGDKADELRESHEAEKEKTEAKRQEKFKEEQKSLEDELGF